MSNQAEEFFKQWPAKMQKMRAAAPDGVKGLEAGATKEQIMEAAEVAVVMQGGPTYTYLPKVVEALEALAKKSET